MKKIIILVFICFSVLALAQSKFTVNGESYHLDEIQHQHTYLFLIENDGIKFVLEDSATISINYANQLKLTEEVDIKEKTNYRIIAHYSKNGEDSIVSYYRGKKLIKSFNKTLDRYGRVRSTSLVDYEDKKRSKAFNYLYQDTIVDDWKIASQYVFATYARQFRSFNHRIDAYIDQAGDTVKLVTVTNTKDSTVSYPAHKFSFRVNRYKKRSGNLNYEEEVEITPVELENPKRLMRKYLEPLKHKFSDYRYTSLRYYYYNADKTISLKITKTDTERSVVLTHKIKK